MELKTLIIDDETLARQRLFNLAKDVPELNIIGECATGKEAIKAINKLKPDLIFLDIQLKDLTGFDVLEKITTEQKPLVVFVTAYNEYALKAFDFFAFDYLLKPYKDSRFLKAIENIIDYNKNRKVDTFEDKMQSLLEYVQKNQNSSTVSSEKLPIKLGNKVFVINTKDIKYILASGYYAEIFTFDKTHLLRESLTNLIETLDKDKFIRIHRSTIINLNEVEGLINSNYGEIDVKMSDNKLFRISKSYKKVFLTKMGL
jgi:two-component system LytT family response regulator